MTAMTITVSAFCANCDARKSLDRHGRCGTCGSDAVTYHNPPLRDARASMMRHIFGMLRLNEEER